MSTYPRLTRANLRSLVREITGILSTDVITDARINEWLNESLYNINAIGDNLGVNWHQGLAPYGPVLVQDVSGTGVLYRFPGWEWDDTTAFPSGLKANLYMESDGDTPPWNDGHFDTLLAYDTASRIFKQIADDTARATEYEAKFKELGNILFRNKFLSHNARFIDEYNTANSGANAFISLYLKTLMLLGDMVSIDAALDISSIVRYTVTNEYWALTNAYKWPFAVSTYNGLFSFGPFIDIFSYGAAARIAGERGMAEMVVKSLQENYDVRLDALKTKYLKPVAKQTAADFNTQAQAGSLAQDLKLDKLITKTEQLVGEFALSLPDGLIQQWLIEEATMIGSERNWSSLQQTGTLVLPAGSNLFTPSIFDDNQRLESLWLCDDNGNPLEEIKQRPHLLDVDENSPKYYYSKLTSANYQDEGQDTYQVAPTPTKNIVLKYKYSFTNMGISSRYIIPGDVNSGLELFWSFHKNYLMLPCYRVAVKCLAFLDSPKLKTLGAIYLQSAENIHEQMVRFYQLDHTEESFQLGVDGTNAPKYIPLFKVN